MARATSSRAWRYFASRRMTPARHMYRCIMMPELDCKGDTQQRQHEYPQQRDGTINFIWPGQQRRQHHPSKGQGRRRPSSEVPGGKQWAEHFRRYWYREVCRPWPDLLEPSRFAAAELQSTPVVLYNDKANHDTPGLACGGSSMGRQLHRLAAPHLGWLWGGPSRQRCEHVINPCTRLANERAYAASTSAL